MIAMALACEPKLLIADEPTTALDVTIQAQILDLLDDLRERLGMAIMLITHDMGVIAGRTDRVLVMYAGKIVESATTPSCSTGMRHPYSEALLQSVPKLDAGLDRPLVSIPGLPPDLSKAIDGCRFAPRCLYARSAAGPGAGARPAGDSEPGHLLACFHPVRASDHGQRPEAVASRPTSATRPTALGRAADGRARPAADDPRDRRTW